MPVKYVKPIAHPRKIVLFGAGKSATVLIDYLCSQRGNDWHLFLVDADLERATEKIAGRQNARAIRLDILQDEARSQWIEVSDLVISMLPAQLHYLVARDCLRLGKNLLTASYADAQLREMAADIESAGLLFLCESGLDPGIDHMSAMQVIDRIRREQGQIISFRSYCGGLVAPASDSNPWHYKISWNPANIVNAGKSGARYKKKGQVIELDHRQVFDQTTPVYCPDGSKYACYANRDSLTYTELYGLEAVPDFLRGTLRHPDFCTGWKYIIAAGLTATTPFAPETDLCSYRDLLTACLKLYTPFSSFDQFLAETVPADQQALVRQLFDYLDLTADIRLAGHADPSPASVLQALLEEKLRLDAGDRDMVVMQHEIRYRLGAQQFRYTGCLKATGDDDRHTAMAKTVGLPLGIAAGMVLDGRIGVRGLHIPVLPEIYNPVLEALRQHQIRFDETVKVEE
ncbi:saccharopine dehydrogenase C-terminal domain-containing protein [Niabella terrae]